MRCVAEYETERINRLGKQALVAMMDTYQGDRDAVLQYVTEREKRSGRLL